MKALSVRQPWAWLILYAGKDIENRVWSTNVRGRVLVHAGKGMTKDEYHEAPLYNSGGEFIVLPPFEGLQRGGVVWSVEIVDCVTKSDSPWFNGPYGFLLRNPKILPFTPWRGQLGFFDVPDDVINSKG